MSQTSKTNELLIEESCLGSGATLTIMLMMKIYDNCDGCICADGCHF